jgi:hypothetical protein
MLAGIPWTVAIILPVNKALQATEPETAGARIRAQLQQLVSAPFNANWAWAARADRLLPRPIARWRDSPGLDVVLFLFYKIGLPRSLREGVVF